jgi:hypothetical protein
MGLEMFVYDHMAPHLQAIGRRFWELAAWLLENLPDNAERDLTVGDLYEARGQAIRSMVRGADKE